jgi:hypothetical protein
MVEFTMNWDAMNAIEKTQWLSRYILEAEQSFEFGDNAETFYLLHRCENVIKESQHRLIWIKNVTSEVSAHVYDGMSEAQIQHPDTVWAYYEYFHTSPASLRGRCLYFAKRNLAV